MLARWPTNRQRLRRARPRRREELKALVERAQQGDRAALEELYLIHFDRIYSYLHVTVGNRHDAEDLTTQTFLKMLESIGRSAGSRRRSRRGCSGSRTTSRWTTSAPAAAGSPRRRCPSRRPEESSAEDEAMQSIGRASMLELIEELSHEQQQVLTLKFVFNFSNRRSATILGKTEGAIKSLQHRALVSLQKRAARLSRGARGRHRRPARVGQDLALHRADEGGRRGLRQDARRHGADRDDRLGQLAQVVSARKVTPAAIRVAGRPRHGPGAARDAAAGRRAARRRSTRSRTARPRGRPRER